MTLKEEAERRVTLAREIGREPLLWRAAPGTAAELADGDGTLVGLPVEDAVRSWPLELVCAPLTSQ